MPAKTAQCKRCGSTSVGWVQSKRTQKWYLAFATPTHSIQLDGGRVAGETGMAVHPHLPHKCDDPVRGGYKACPLCGKHHVTPLGQPRKDWCERYV